VILADTSAWVEYDRATGSAVDQRLTALIAGGGPLAVTEPVLMEVLAGARDEDHRRRLRRVLKSISWIETDAHADFEAAARIYASCRVAGITPRGLMDCLIAAIAIRTNAAMLAADRDFAAIATVMPLRIA